MSVKIIEIDYNKSLQLAETIEEAMIIEGDGTDQEVLEAENLEETDAFIAMTGRDEENLIMAMFALEKGVDNLLLALLGQLETLHSFLILVKLYFRYVC